MTGEIAALGYIGLEVSDMEGWKSFAHDELGVQWVDVPDGTSRLRIDDYASRIRLHEGPSDDLAYLGWEVRDEAALRRLTGKLERAGASVETCGKDLAADRQVDTLIRFRDPEGNVHEAFFGPLQKTNDPFVSPTGTRFKTGRQGLGHVVLSCRDKDAMMAFFTDLLGFRLSDHIRTEVVPGRPLEISFLRCNGRHHSLALAPLPIPKRIVHLMLEATTIDDVGRALHRCSAAGRHLTFTLGRHSNDNMLSFYPLTPSGFDLEYGWGGIEVDEESWHVLTHDANSAWGHVYQRPPRPAKQ
jgi:2,3-dihydroxybiphenyl 1,2-dioxygenase